MSGEPAPDAGTAPHGVPVWHGLLVGRGRDDVSGEGEGFAPPSRDARPQPVPMQDALESVFATLAEDTDLTLRTGGTAGDKFDDSWEFDLLDLDLESLVADTANK